MCVGGDGNDFVAYSTASAAATCATAATSTRKSPTTSTAKPDPHQPQPPASTTMPPRPSARLGQFALPTRPRTIATPLNASSSSSSATPLAAAAPRLQQTRAMKTIAARHPLPTDRFNRGPGLPVLGTTPAAALARKAPTTPLRTGALAIKKGMTALFDPATGIRTPCTVLQLDRCEVVAHKTRAVHGYWACAVGAGWKHPSNVTRPLLGHWAAQGVSPKRWVAEFRVRDERGLLGVGERVGAEWFREGDFVDARAEGRGFGFAGVSFYLFFFLIPSAIVWWTLCVFGDDCGSLMLRWYNRV